jgi:hypothetical protein
VDETLDLYDTRAEDFREVTGDHDISQNMNAALQRVRGNLPFAILDFACGPGRHLKAFTDFGHHAIGLEGASKFIAMAWE